MAIGFNTYGADPIGGVFSGFTSMDEFLRKRRADLRDQAYEENLIEEARKFAPQYYNAIKDPSKREQLFRDNPLIMNQLITSMAKQGKSANNIFGVSTSAGSPGLSYSKPGAAAAPGAQGAQGAPGASAPTLASAPVLAPPAQQPSVDTAPFQNPAPPGFAPAPAPAPFDPSAYISPADPLSASGSNPIQTAPGTVPLPIIPKSEPVSGPFIGSNPRQVVPGTVPLPYNPATSGLDQVYGGIPGKAGDALGYVFGGAGDWIGSRERWWRGLPQNPRPDLDPLTGIPR